MITITNASDHKDETNIFIYQKIIMVYLSKKVKSLRNYANLSQEQMADLLQMSRVTYATIESGKRDLKKNELEKIAHIFEISVQDLLNKPVTKTRISKDHPLYKMMQTILYVLSQCAGKPNVGKVVLNKLLYFADFNHYEKYWSSITGDVYVKMPMWPVPKSIDAVAALMEKWWMIESITSDFHWYNQVRFIPNEKPDLSIFTATELAELDSVITKYSDKTGKRLTEYSHGDMPWKATENIGDEVSYGLVHYRTSLYSVVEPMIDD